MARINILSLDGGGTFALIQARALGRLYGDATPGHAILANFDFAFANSGGSIVLGGLLANLSPATIANYFTDARHRNAMFKRTFISRVRPGFLPGAQFSAAAKQAKLRDIFGPVPLQTLDHGSAAPRRYTHAAMMAFDFDRSRAFFFRSGWSPRDPTIGVPLADAIHASTNAPVNYFDAPARFPVTIAYRDEQPIAMTMQFWDGGITGLNNPVAAAVAEALAVGHAPGDIAALSIGTGTTVRSNNPFHTAAPGAKSDLLIVTPEKSSLLGDLKKLATSAIGDPPDFATFVAHTMLGGQAPAATPVVTDTRVVRLNPLIAGRFASDRWSYPDWLPSRDFERLATLDFAATGDGDVALIDALTAAWLADRAPNQPTRFNFLQPDPNGLHAEIGFTRATDAISRWRAIS